MVFRTRSPPRIENKISLDYHLRSQKKKMVPGGHEDGAEGSDNGDMALVLSIILAFCSWNRVFLAQDWLIVSGNICVQLIG